MKYIQIQYVYILYTQIYLCTLLLKFQFAFKGLFPDEDVMEGSMFHGTETRNFEKGECSKESEGINTQILEYFLTFQEIMLTNNEELNKKLDKLIWEVEEKK